MVPFDLLQKWNVSPVIFSEDFHGIQVEVKIQFMSTTVNLSEITVFNHPHCNSGHSLMKFKNCMKISNTFSISCFITL